MYPRNLITVSQLREIIIEHGNVTVEPIAYDYANDRVHPDTSLAVYVDSRFQGLLMTKQWSCTGCSNPIRLDMRYCQHCGTDHDRT